MVTEAEKPTGARVPLTRERVLTAAVAMADAGGLEALTMRGLAESLGVEAMSLYYHVANKEALLDGVAESISAEINREVPGVDGDAPDFDWKSTMRARILAARQVMLRHRWAPALLETRTTMNPEVLRYFDGLLAIFRSGGFSYDTAHHALHALGGRALGFAQELFEPTPGSGDESVSGEMMAAMQAQLPHLFEMLAEIVHDDPDSTLGWCDDQSEFEFGLDLLLDGLDGMRTRR